MIIRVVVAGCRDYNNYQEAEIFIDSCMKKINKKGDIVFVSGGCRGADVLGQVYASKHHCQVECYPAEWKKYGRRAGPKRNQHMAMLGDYFICFWDGESRGTKNMIESAKAYHKPVWIKMISIE